MGAVLALEHRHPPDGGANAWLAVQLVGLKWSAAATVRTFREAAALRRVVRAGEQVNEAAVHALDTAGEQAGLGKIGRRVVNETSTTADDAAEAAAGTGRKLAKHPLYGDVVGDLASSNTEALGRRLGAKVQLDDDLGTGVEVVFHVDEASGRMVCSVRDAETGDLIRQIPNEEVLRMAELAHDETIVLVNERA